MQEKYTESAKHALDLAKKAALSYGHVALGTEHILLGLMEETTGTAGKVLKEAKATPEKLKELLDKLVHGENEEKSGKKALEYTPRAEYVLENAVEEAESFHQELVGTDHLLLALIKETDCVAARLLFTMGVNMQKLYIDTLTAMGMDISEAKEELQAMKNSGEDSVGNTPMLDKYSRDLTRMAAAGKLDPVIGRETEIGRIIQILSRRTKNNPCLIGEPGVGKTAIVEGLAQRIVEGTVPETIAGKRVLVLDLSGMVAGSKYRGEFEERIKKVIAEVMDHPGVLLFIDELHTIIGAGGAEGAMDASNILKPSLSRGEIQIIGATTIAEYRKYIEKDTALERRFQPVTVDEPTEEETLEILRGLRPYYEKHHQVKITDDALDAAVHMSVRYLNDRFLPDKAIDLIDEAAAKVRLNGVKIPKGLKDAENTLYQLSVEKEEAIVRNDFEQAKAIQVEEKELQERIRRLQKRYAKASSGKNISVDAEYVAEVVSDWTKIPLKQITEQESKRLLRMESILHKRVIGQEEAVEAVARAIRRGRTGLKDPRRPIGSFMFLGPTGVGKTELSKALAEAVFGSEKSMIRVDMSEYMEKHSVSKLIGSPPGYVGHEEGGQLSEKVLRNPYSVILFDEIEKAHPDVFNILLHVLDDGHITDSQGRKVDFKQTIIIMTSNTGAQAIQEPKRLGFGAGEDAAADYQRMKDRVMEEVKRSYRPEFINRIDQILVFKPLTKEEIRQIVGLLLKELENRCKNQLELEVSFRPAVLDKLAEKGFDSKFGARPLKREIQTQIEDKLAEELLSGNVCKGDHVTVTLKDDQIAFLVRKKNEGKA